MTEALSYNIEYEPNPQDIHALTRGVFENTVQKKGRSFMQPVAVIVRDSHDKLVGGAVGFMFYGCLHIDQIWVDPEFQGQGIGRHLLEVIERRAKEIGCRIATVQTMSWEAEGFYAKLGFEAEFRRPGYDFGGELIHMRKDL